jgi:creatinine amidohydrolase
MAGKGRGRSVVDSSSTYREIEDADPSTALLPVGATEQHGSHLPLSVDSVVADEIARGVAGVLGALVLPVIPYGNSRAHRGFRGTVWVSHDTMNRMVQDLIGCLFDQRFRRVVVINTHSGNVGLAAPIRDANFASSGGIAIVVHPIELAYERLASVIESLSEERHAGELETSLMLFLRPKLVRGPGADLVPSAPRDYFDALPMSHASRSGVWGRPSLATGKKGAEAFQILVQETTRHILETFERLESLIDEHARGPQVEEGPPGGRRGPDTGA